MARKKDQLTWMTPTGLDGMTFRQGLKYLIGQYPAVLRDSIIAGCALCVGAFILGMLKSALLDRGVESLIGNILNRPSETLLVVLAILAFGAASGAVLSIPFLFQAVVARKWVIFDDDRIRIGGRTMQSSDVQSFHIAKGIEDGISRRFLLLWLREGIQPELAVWVVGIDRKVKDDAVREACLQLGLKEVPLPPSE